MAMDGEGSCVLVTHHMGQTGDHQSSVLDTDYCLTATLHCDYCRAYLHSDILRQYLLWFWKIYRDICIHFNPLYIFTIEPKYKIHNTNIMAQRKKSPIDSVIRIQSGPQLCQYLSYKYLQIILLPCTLWLILMNAKYETVQSMDHSNSVMGWHQNLIQE